MARKSSSGLLRNLTLTQWSFAAVAVAVVASMASTRDPSDGCTQHVYSAARQFELSQPSDPNVMEIMYERLGYAADLCDQGRPQQAKQILETLSAFDYRS